MHHRIKAGLHAAELLAVVCGAELRTRKESRTKHVPPLPNPGVFLLRF
jgi:hypothetical protein